MLGLAEAAAHVAAAVSDNFSVVTVRGTSQDSARELLRSYGFGERLVSVRGIDSSLAALGRDQELWCEAVRHEARLAYELDRAGAVILGGAFFVGMAERVRVQVPVIDPLVAALKAAEAVIGAKGDLVATPAAQTAEPQ